MISVRKIGDNFSRAAASYERYADIQGRLAEGLLEELSASGCEYQSILDIGCGTGWLLENLKKYFPCSRLLGLDISFEMAHITRGKMFHSLVADAALLPVQDESFDLALSNAVYQWVFDLDAAFREAQRVLKNGGCLMFNCFGAQTLEELRYCLMIEENYLPREELIRECLGKARFSGIELKKSIRKKYFDNLVDILSWLKYIGANRINGYQPFLTPQRLAEANYAYSCNYRTNGKVYATFEVIQVRAVK